MEKELIKQLKGIRRELEKIRKALANDRKYEKYNSWDPTPNIHGHIGGSAARKKE